MARKKALITGVTGQDGAYLARFLLAKGYEVHGMKRRASSFNTKRIDDIYVDPHEEDVSFFLHYGDMTDSSNIMRLVQSIEPDEIHNLAAQSHVQVSFDTAEYTANTDAFGTLRFLEAIRTLDIGDKTRFYQASTSELYGKAQQAPQSETTPFYPRSPYAVAKLNAYWICVNYREAYGLHAIINHDVGDDFVLATGRTETVRRFVELAFAELDREIVWHGDGVNEVGKDAATGKVLVEIDPRYFRPTEVDFLVGDASKAKEKLGWEAKIGLEELVSEMVRAKLNDAR